MNEAPPVSRPQNIASRHGKTGMVCTLAVAVLAACGGGEPGPAPSQPVAQSAQSAQKAAAFNAQALTAPQGFFPNVPIPADAAQKGMFSPVYNWPLITVHAVLMPDGRVMSYGTDGTGRQTGNFIYDLWDGTAAPDTGHLTLPNTTATDIFCSSQLVLPVGEPSVFIAGGDNWTGTGTTNTGNNNSNVFTGSSNTLARGNNMNRPRWYSTSTTLLNGETYIQGGTGGTDRPEVRQADGTFRLLTGADTGALDFMYPRNFIAPDGRVFGYDSAGRMYYVAPGGTGSITRVGQFGSQYSGSDASAAMFAPGRILQFGGSSNGALVIDITGGAPVVTPTQSMSSQRRLVNAAILADGRVLATGGSQVWNELTGVNNIAEIWNPQTGQWTQGAVGARARLYHSASLLLPDASVLVSGGGAPGPQNNLNAEIYYPPYLFTAGGQRAPRPGITSAPAWIDIGKTFAVDVSDLQSASRVTFAKSGSVTHSWNMEQRFMDLTFRQEGARLYVQAPTRAADAPPGYYQLFVFNEAGVPSMAKIVQVTVAGTMNPALTPTLANPGPQNGSIGTAVNLALNASDPNGDALIYAAAGLPPGLSIDTATGRISGTPTQVGSYDVVLTATDGLNSASVTLVWTVTNTMPLVLSPPPAQAPTLINTTVSFTASATGVGVSFRWNFGDGTPATGWTASADAQHSFSQPGTYWVTVSARDSVGDERTQVFLQVVHLPLTARRPASSSNIAIETPAAGNQRLWVVNQDNDSVSVFDAVTRTRLGEVAVGASPRALAVAGDGSVWVTNKQGASISVINPATRTVSRTIALPRGSQPFGMAMAPGANVAYVALEATGQLLRFDTATFAQTGAVGVGANPRHVSVAADGASVYVSRFITPPLPGEGTATVAPTAATGGELVVVNAATLGVARTIVLAHSDKQDFENQGRGIPNYLGAAVISPDGTQAWVPSKQDNVKRGALRDGTGLNFQSTVRAISSRVALGTQTEDLAKRIDHDNASLASAAVYDPTGVYLFVALETSREVAVIDAHQGFQLFRVDVGRAPQGLALSPDGATLFVNNFMDRTVGAYDLRPLLRDGRASVPLLGMLAAVATERLGAQVLAGKQLFYDARDPRLARDRYMSCATCHNDGGHDGRVWDLTGFGEGLRNTISLRGRAAMGHGHLHWSNNFNELQDFEGQIRALAGGTGLMSDAAFNTGTRSQPLGDAKAGVSADLDALAAYVASLGAFDVAPQRPSATTLSTAAMQGRVVFQAMNCAACHADAAFTASAVNNPANVGTIKSTSGQRLGAALSGIDIPTLRDVWATAPYLHDGSMLTLEGAVRAHTNVTINDADLTSVAAYLREIGSDEAGAPVLAGTGGGLTGRYYANRTLANNPVLTRVEAIDFNWGTGSPGTGVPTNKFSARWTGMIEAPTAGAYRIQTISDDGVRVWVNGSQVINNWTDHSTTTNTSAVINLTAGQRVPITVEYYENGGSAVMRLLWLTPGATTYVAVPRTRLYTN
jgi:YVTN family beta-propeller protein